MPPGPRPRPGGFLPLKRLCVARRASRLGRLEAPRRYTDSSVILTPLWHYRERNTVQRGANQGRVTGSSMRHLQTRADPCTVRIITRSWSKKTVRAHYSAHRLVPLAVSTQCPLRELLRSSRTALQRCAQRCGKGCRIEQVLAPPLLQRPYRCWQIVGEQQKCCRASCPWATAVLWIRCVGDVASALEALVAQRNAGRQGEPASEVQQRDATLAVRPLDLGGVRAIFAPLPQTQFQAEGVQQEIKVGRR